MLTINHWAAGAEYEGTGGNWAEVTNPATGQATARVRLASTADAAHVIAGARAAAGPWARTSLARRTQVAFAFRELLNARREELARIITSEHGKVHGCWSRLWCGFHIRTVVERPVQAGNAGTLRSPISGPAPHGTGCPYAFEGPTALEVPRE